MRVCILHPRHFDEELFRGRVEAGGCDIDIDIRTAGYGEGFELRTLKAHRAPVDEILGLSPAVSDDLRDMLSSAEVVQALDVPLGLLELAPRLRWVQAIGAGVWHLYPGELTQAEVVVTNASGVASTAIAEFVFARLMELWKGLAELRTAQAERRWQPREARTLAGATLGIVGVGAIGSETARIGRCLGMKVMGIKRHPRHPATGEMWGGPEQLPELLRTADVIVISVPENDETRRLIGAAELSMMRPDAVLCNVSRGSVVDESALVDALEQGRIGAAILDVTEQEPLDPSSRLWTTPNLYLSPHCAASNSGYRASFTELFADNFLRFVADQPMRNLVDPTKGY